MELRAEEISQIIKEQITDYDKKIELSETGVVLSVGDGIARVYGLEKAMALELVEFPGGVLGLVLNLEEDNVGIAIMGEDTGIKRATWSNGPARLPRCPWAKPCLAAWFPVWVSPSTAKAPSKAPKPAVSRWWPPACHRQKIVCTNPATPASRRSTP
jgi:F-type H+-transporting ATPase subunit alpha